jgi:hypothetical protein
MKKEIGLNFYEYMNYTLSYYKNDKNNILCLRQYHFNIYLHQS